MAHREVGESEISPIPNPPQPTVTGQSHLNGNEFPEEVIIFLHSMIKTQKDIFGTHFDETIEK